MSYGADIGSAGSATPDEGESARRGARRVADDGPRVAGGDRGKSVFRDADVAGEARRKSDGAADEVGRGRSIDSDVATSEVAGGGPRNPDSAGREVAGGRPVEAGVARTDAARAARRRERDRAGNMLPGRERRRLRLERVLVRLVATSGVVGIGVALGAILVSSTVQGWITGLVVALVSVVLSAILWSSRQV